MQSALCLCRLDLYWSDAELRMEAHVNSCDLLIFTDWRAIEDTQLIMVRSDSLSHTHTHTHVHTRTQNTDTDTYTLSLSFSHTHTHTHAHTPIHTYTRTQNRDTYILTLSFSITHTHILTHTHLDFNRSKSHVRKHWMHKHNQTVDWQHLQSTCTTNQPEKDPWCLDIQCYDGTACGMGHLWRDKNITVTYPFEVK